MNILKKECEIRVSFNNEIVLIYIKRKKNEILELFSNISNIPCLWHSISITGNTQQSIILRYATLFTMLLLKNNFIELIKIKDYPNKYELVFEKYC